VIVPDKWKEGTIYTTKSGGRKVNENKLLSKKHRYPINPSFILVIYFHSVFFTILMIYYYYVMGIGWTPYGTTKCTICKQQLHQEGRYCLSCAYKKGMSMFMLVFCSYIYTHNQTHNLLHILLLQLCALCVESKYLTQPITSRAMCSMLL